MLDPLNGWGLKEWPKGGAGVRKRPEPVLEPVDEPVTPQPEPIKAKSEVVQLANPKWSVKEAHFEDKVGLSLDVALPESLKDIKRVIITVFSISPKGIRTQVKAKDLYVDQGKVTGEFELETPPREGDKEAESCEYVFTAKHRDSKEVESPRLPAKAKPRGSDELVLEVPATEELKGGGHAFQLMSNDRTIIWKIETKNVQEKDGKLTLKFQKLDPHLRYSMDFLDGQGSIIDSIFSDMPFGKWAEESK